MNQRFAESLFNKEHKVCGVLLQPLTFWHLALLDFCDSPYLDGRKRRGEDLALAIAICSTKPQLPFFIPILSWYKKRKVSRIIARYGVPDADAAFGYYFEDYSCAPLMWSQKSDKSIKTPASLFCVAMLMRFGRMTAQQAWATEIGYGRWLISALSEAGGADVQVITDAELEAMKEAGH